MQFIYFIEFLWKLHFNVYLNFKKTIYNYTAVE